jgi:hypothetical protein
MKVLLERGVHGKFGRMSRYILAHPAPVGFLLTPTLPNRAAHPSINRDVRFMQHCSEDVARMSQNRRVGHAMRHRNH